MFNTTIERCLDSKLSTFLTEFTKIKSENIQLVQRCTNMESELDKAKEQISILQARVEAMDSYSRRDNLIINGLKVTSFADAASVPSQSSQSSSSDQMGPAKNDSSIEKAVIDLCNNLNVNISAADISAAHRLGSARTGSASANTQHTPPIIVRFTSRRARDLVYGARKNLKSTSPKVFINEHLSKENATLFRDARLLVKAKKLQSAWSMNGSIFVKVTDTSQPVRVINRLNLPSR